MAKPRNRGNLPAKPVTPPPGPAPEGDDIELPDALFYLRSLNPEDGDLIIRVYQYMGGVGRAGGPKEFLFGVELDDLPGLEEKLAEMYPAGGRFQVVARKNGRIVSTATINIATRPNYKPPPPAWAAPPQPSVQGQNDASTDRLVSMFENMMRVQQQSAEDNRRFMESMATRLTQPAGGMPTSLEGMVDMLAKVQALLPKGANESSLEMFEKGMTFYEKIAGNSEGGRAGGRSALVELASELIKSPAAEGFGKAIAQAMQQPPTGAAPQQLMTQNPAPPPMMGPGFNPFTPGAAIVSPQNRQALNIIEMLIGQAQAGSQPDMIAEQLLPQMPEPILEELEAQDDIVAYLETQFPQVKSHHDWFVALIGHMFVRDDGQSAGTPEDVARDYVNARDDRAPQSHVANPGGSGGDSRNPETDARPGVAGQNQS